MRGQANNTIAVEITVRHTRSDGVQTHSHEVVVTDGLNHQAKWLNRRVVAVVDSAVSKVLADFGVTSEQAALGRLGDFTTDTVANGR